jgi:hypothetical protein
MPIDYTLSVVAFLDVLGWSDLVERSVRDEALRNSMAVSIAAVNRVLGFAGGRPPDDSGWPVIGQFSDSIIVSRRLTGPTGPAQRDAFDIALNAICKNMLEKGFFLRGGVTEGLMYHYGAVAFGPALTRAASLEKAAVFPRVLIDEGDCEPSVSIPIRKFGDNQPFFDILAVLRDPRMPKGPDDNQIQAEYLQFVRPHFLFDLTPFREGHANAQRIFKKHEWFRGYFNEIAAAFGVEPVPI